MKKMLVLLLALAIVGGVFAVDVADGFAITGEIVTGLAVTAGGGADDPWIMPQHDGEDTPFRARVNLGYTNDIFGAKVRFQARNPYDRSDGPETAIPKAFGWVNLLNKMIVISGGMDVDAIYGVGGYLDTDNDGVTGGRVEVRPINGLSIALGVPVEKPALLKYGLGDVKIGAKYGNDIFSVVVSSALHHAEENVELDPGDPENQIPPTYGDTDFWLDLLFGVDVTAIQNLDISLTGRLVTTDAGFFRIAPKVAYTAGKLSAYGAVDVAKGNTLFSGDIVRDGYKTGETYAGPAGKGEKSDDLGLGIEAGVGFQITDLIGVGAKLGSDNLVWFEGNGLWAKPYVGFTISPNASIGVYDKIGKIGANSDYYKVDNTFGVDFTWTF